MADIIERMPPNDLGAEEAVLGSILIDPSVMPHLAGTLRGDDFFREKNRWVYEACLKLFDNRETTNQIAVAHELAREGQLEGVGGTAYLGYLVAEVPTSVHAEHYAKIVRNMAFCRLLAMRGQQITTLAMDVGGEVGDLLAKAQELILELELPGAKPLVISPYDMADFAMSRYCDLRDRGDKATLSTGLMDLDGHIGGLHPGDLVIVGARPSVGKTSLLMSMARVATPCLFCSAEMSQAQLSDREVSQLARVPVTTLWRGNYDEMLFERILEAIGVMSEQQIWRMAGRGANTRDIERVASELIRRTNLKAVFVDYVQILTDEYGRNANERVGFISRRLKSIATSLNVPVVAASQLSREVERGTINKRPRLIDLRESGTIEQDADTVLLLYRDDYYYPTELEWRKVFKAEPYPRGIMEINIAKQRQGKSRQTLKVTWVAELMEYRDLARGGE